MNQEFLDQIKSRYQLGKLIYGMVEAHTPWGRDLFAAVRSIVNTSHRQDLSAFESILAALNLL